MLTVGLLLVLAALGVTIAHAVRPGRAPLWIAVLLLCLAALVGAAPIVLVR